VAFLLDTTIVSELRRVEPDPKVTAWIAGVASADLFLSTLIVGEIGRVIELLRPNADEHARALDVWLGGLVTAYRDRLLPVTAAVADAWGRLGAPRPLQVADASKLATADTDGPTFVTSEAQSFADLGVAALSPRDSPS